MTAAMFAETIEPVSPPDARPGLSTVSRPGPSPVAAPARVETGLFDTVTASIFGRPDPGSWRPLPLSTLLSEGWNEAWAPPSKGSGGAPRQAWINAATGHLTRGWFFTFSYGADAPPKGNAYLGAYTLMTPLSRRLMLITNVPYVLRNNADGGLPVIEPPGRPTSATRSHTGFGDVSFTPRVLLHETKDLSLTAELAVLTPTGARPLAGRTALTPAVAFWTDLPGGWVVRGGVGDLISPRGGGNTLISQLAAGQTLTGHDVPVVGDFSYYLSAVANTPLAGGGATTATLTPGLRTHLGRNWYLLAGLPTPVTRARVADLGVVLWFVKSW